MANSSEDRPNLAATFVSQEQDNDAREIVNSSPVESNSRSVDYSRVRTDSPGLAVGQIIGGCYEIIQPLKFDVAANEHSSDRYQDLGRDLHKSIYRVRDRNDAGNSRSILELIAESDSSENKLTPESFEQQVKLVNKLATQGQIPKLLAHGIEKKQYYVVYEQIRGESLAKTLKYRGLNEAEIVNLVQDMARIYDLLLKNKIVNCHFLPQSILKSQNNQRYVLANLQELLLNPPITSNLSSQKQQSLFQEQLRLLGYLIIQSVTEQKYDREIGTADIPLNWYQKVNLSPRLQNILGKMVALDRKSSYQSLPQIIADFKPLVKINRVIGGKYRLIRYLGAKNGIKTYLARNIKPQGSSSSLLIVKQTTIADFHLSASAESISDRKFNVLEAQVKRLQQIAREQKLDLVWEKQEERAEIYLIRNYQEGISLNKRLNQEKQLSPTEAIHLLTETLQVLQSLHQQQLIHRNLKPSNLILSGEDRKVTLVDWGILQGISDCYPSHQNRHSRQAPEQIVGRPTSSSDLYALGIVTIEALTGLSVPEIPPNSSWGKLLWQERLISHPFLIEIISKMICPDVAQRYQSAEKVLADLEEGASLAFQTRVGKETRPHLVKFKANSSALKNKLLNLAKKPQKLGIAIAISACLVTALEGFAPFLRPQYYLHRGQKQLTSEPEIALTAFERAIELKPKQVEAWQGKGETLLALKEVRSALAAYEQAIKLDFENVESWRRRGDIHYSVNNFQQALESYDRVLELDPENAIALSNKGKTLATLSRYPEALVHQKKALAIANNANAELLSETASSALVLRKYNQALTLFNRARDIAPLQPNLWQDKIIALQEPEGNTAVLSTVRSIEQSYERALEKQPHDLALWLGKGDFFRRLKRYPMALNAYNQAIDVEPELETPWLGKAKVLQDMQQYPAALSAVERALRLQPQSFVAWYDRGTTLQQEERDLNEAIAAYDMAIAINADFFPAWRDRGTILIEQKEYEKAIDSLRKAVSLAPQDIDSWLNLSTALSKQDKLDEAIDASERVIVLQPRNSSYWLQKGSLWELKKDSSQACATYLQGVQIAPDLKLKNAIARLDCE